MQKRTDNEDQKVSRTNLQKIQTALIWLEPMFTMNLGDQLSCNPIVCLCDVITRSYFSSLIKQLCIMIVCLFPKLSLDIRFRMTDAKFV